MTDSPFISRKRPLPLESSDELVVKKAKGTGKGPLLETFDSLKAGFQKLKSRISQLFKRTETKKAAVEQSKFELLKNGKTPNSLNRYSKLVLLEQVLRFAETHPHHINIFSRLLFVCKQFLTISKCHRICRFWIKIKHQDVHFYYTSFRESKGFVFRMNLAKAKRFVLTVKPMVFCVVFNLREQQTSPFTDLLLLADGEIELYANRPNVNAQLLLRIVSMHWRKFTALSCPASALPSYFTVHNFNYLRVSNIESTNKLKEILRHNTKILELDMLSDFVNETDTSPESTGNICYCSIFTSLGSTLPSIKYITKSCPTLKKLYVVNHSFTLDAQQMPVDDLLIRNMIRYNVYNQAMRALLQTNIRSSLNIIARYSGDSFMLPAGWLDPLLNDDYFSLLNHKTSVDGDEVTTHLGAIHTNHNFTARFCVKFRYEYLLPQLAIVLNPDEEEHLFVELE